MIVNKSKEKSKKIEIDLNSPEGNAFALLGLVDKICKDNKIEGREDILEEMKSSDYENLIQTIDKYFGDSIIMYRG